MNLPWDSKSKSVERPEGAYVRPASDPRYHTTRWTKLSRRWRIAHPLCERCRQRGIIREATCVDHIEPIPIHEDFFDESNLQSLCNECNMLKGYEDRKKIQEWRRRQGEGG